VIDMCDVETKLHLQKIETKIELIRLDVLWIKRVVMLLIVVIGSIFGLDLKGLM